MASQPGSLAAIPTIHAVLRSLVAGSLCTRPGPDLFGAGANAVWRYNMRTHFSASLDRVRSA